MTRPRPLAGLPPVTGEQVAKAWLLELLAAAPLARASAIASTQVASAGPALGAALVAALGDDGALAALAGPDGPARLLRELADALEPAGGSDAAPATIVRPPALAPAEGRPPARTTGRAAAVVDVAEALRAAAATCLAPGGAEVPGLHDRLAHATSRLTHAALAGALRPAWPADAPGAPPVGGAAPSPSPSVPVGAPVAAPTFAGRMAAGGPISLLLVEVQDAERLEQAGQDASLLGADAALRGALPREASISGDEPGRWTILAQADGGLARRLVDAVGAVAGPHGVPLRGVAGVARMPADGRTAADLVAAAEARLDAARAAGVEVLA